MASDFVRLLRSALARRIAFVVVAALLASVGIGRANAQVPGFEGCYSDSYTSPFQCPDRQTAYERAHAVAVLHNNGDYVVSCYATLPDDYDRRFYHCSFKNSVGAVTNASRMWRGGDGCPAGSEWDDESNSCKQPCDANSPPLSAGQYLVSDVQICSGGCKYSGAGELCVGTTVDAQQAWYCSTWKPTGDKCAVGDGDSPLAPSDGDGDGSSDGNDSAPNNPGQGGGGKDGKPNEDGGGKGDGNGPGEGSGNGNTSGGGGNCASPPSSSGDAILAQIAYQTWATRCAIEGAKDGNGNLKTTQGDGNGSGPGGGEGEGEGTDFGTSNPGEDEAFDPAEVKRFGIPVNTNMLDSEAIFGGGACPVLSVTIYGKTFSTNEIPSWCDLLRILRSLVLIFAAFTALRILMGNNT